MVRMAKVGCGPLAAFLIILVALVMIGGNQAMSFYFENCQFGDLMDCLLGNLEEPEEGSVVATGTYTFKGYDVNITANIPLNGGTVTGTVSGTCDGQIQGTFDGKNNGVITGQMKGACSPFFVPIPSSATFSGTVNKTGKTVPFHFDGQGGGMTKSDSMTLTY